MKPLVFALLVGLTTVSGPILAADETAAQIDLREAQDVSIDQFLWTNRLIVVFADSPQDPAFKKQIALLSERPQDLLDRDVVVITDTEPTSASDIREQLRPRGFSWVLVDKDGEVKLRKPSPWDVREISRSIDKTDLRQQELRDARSGETP